MDDSQVVEATAVRADLVARPGVLDEEAAALARVARVLALELGVGEAGLNGHRHTEGLCFWGGGLCQQFVPSSTQLILI